MKNALICTAAVLGLVFIGSAEANAGGFRFTGHHGYNSHNLSHSNSYYNGGHRNNYSYGNAHTGNGYYNSGFGHGNNYGHGNGYGYGHQNRGYTPGHGYSGTSIQFNGNHIDFYRTTRYGH